MNETLVETNVGQVAGADDVYNRQRCAQVANDLSASDRIRAKHEQRMRELVRDELRFRNKFLRMREAVQVELVAMRAYRQVYRAHSLPPHNNNNNNNKSKTSNLKEKTAPSEEREPLRYTYSNPDSDAKEETVGTQTNHVTSRCNTTNWKYALVPNFAKAKEAEVEQTKKETREQVKASLPPLKVWQQPLERPGYISKVFPDDCKTPFSYCRMIQSEVDQLTSDWSPANVRRMKAKTIHARDRKYTQDSRVNKREAVSALVRTLAPVSSKKLTKHE